MRIAGYICLALGILMLVFAIVKAARNHAYEALKEIMRSRKSRTVLVAGMAEAEYNFTSEKTGSPQAEEYSTSILINNNKPYSTEYIGEADNQEKQS